MKKIVNDCPYGHFLPDGAFCVTTRKTPRNWYNYLFNDNCITAVSQVGAGDGFAQDAMGRRVSMVTGRQVYIFRADAGKWWTANGLPISRRLSRYSCVHRPGATTILAKSNGIASEFTVSVHESAPGELWTVKLTNTTRARARLQLVPYCSTDIDGGYFIQTYNTGVGRFAAESNSVILRSSAAFGSADACEIFEYMMADAPCKSFDTRRNAFIGVYGTTDEPAAMMDNGGHCSGTDCLGEKLCMALEQEISLGPGESVTRKFAISISKRDDAAAEIAEAFFAEGSSADAQKSAARAKSWCGNLEIRTPNGSLNALANTWLQYQTVLGARWARIRHNGYRDIVSDADCLLVSNPKLALADLERILTYQYSNGYAPRTFRDGWICDNRFSDCASGIAPAVYDAVMELGDMELLDREVRFNDGTSASLYEHCKRAVDYLWNFRGPHGLVKIWGGDWNDCMDRVGIGGKGESVWLSMAWCHANRCFAKLARLRGRDADAAEADERGEEMKRVINDTAWDGEYYIYAYKDDGTKVGSRENTEGAVFLNPQLWAVMSGVITPERLPKVLNTIDVLLDDPLGTLVMTPGYSRIDQSIGMIGTKPAGVHENGGIYLHTMCWKIAFEALLRRVDKLYRTLQQTIPVDDSGHSRMCEPYVMCNSIFGRETGYRYGTPGQSWRSASGQWLLKSLAYFIFGLQPELGGLKLNPCIPEEWGECSVMRKFRDATYRIKYVRDADARGAMRITVNGKPSGALLPYAPGMTYRVTVRSSPSA